MATGGYDASPDNASDIIDEHITEMCESCIKKLHPKTTTAKLKHHEIILVKKTDSLSTALDCRGMDKCTQHMKKVKFYCEDHDQLCCCGCVIAHRKCDKFIEINALSVQKGIERDLQSVLMKVKSDCLTMIQDMKQLDVALTETVANLSTEIDEIRNKLLKLIDDDKYIFLQETEKTIAENTNILDQRKEVLSNVAKDISESFQAFSEALEKGTPQQEFIIARAVEKKMKEAQSVIEEQRKQPLLIKMHLSFSNELSKLLRTEDNNVKLHVDETCEHEDYCRSSVEKLHNPIDFLDNDLQEKEKTINELLHQLECERQARMKDAWQTGQCISKLKDDLKRIEHENQDAWQSAEMTFKTQDNIPNIADLSDEYRPTKLAVMFCELFDNQWTDAFDELSIHFKAEKPIIGFLLNIILLSYEFCSRELAFTWEIACKWYMVEKQEQVLKKQFIHARKLLVGKNLEEMQQKFVMHLERVFCDDKKKVNLSGAATSIYVAQCVKLSLLMCAFDPPVVMVCPGRLPFIETLEDNVNGSEFGQPECENEDPKDVPVAVNLSKTDSNNDNRSKAIRVLVQNTAIAFDRELYKEFIAKGPTVEYFVWPVLYLHEGGLLLSKGIAQGMQEMQHKPSFSSDIMPNASRDTDPNIDDLSDQCTPTRLAEMFSELFDNQWTTAYTALLSQRRIKERQAIDFLLDIFMVTYVYCNAQIGDYKEDKDQRNKWILGEAQAFEQNIEHVLVDMSARQITRSFLSNPNVRAYLSECVRLCLLMGACDPPVVVECPGRPALGLEERVLDVKQPTEENNLTVLDVKQQTEENNSISVGPRMQFNKGIYNEYTCRGKYLECIVWPVMYVNKSGNLLAKGVAQGTGKKTPSQQAGPWIWWQ